MIPMQRILLPTEPTPAQLAAGRYKKRRVEWKGLVLRIENEAGSFRRGRKPDGSEWETLMHFAYGEVERTEGVDGDPVDVFLGPAMETAPMVYVVHQRTVNDWDKYDEDKCMVGFDSEADAVAAFLSSYDDPRFLGPVTAMPVEEFIRKARATRTAPAMIKALFFSKAHIAGYTKKDGTYVAPHSDKRPAAHKPEEHFAHIFADPGFRAIAKAADEALPDGAARAIDGFIGVPHDALEMGMGFGLMSARALEDAYGPSPTPRGVTVRAELETAFAPVREALRRRLGDSVKLYRAQRPEPPAAPGTINMSAAEDGSRNVLSWTSDLEFVNVHAGVKPPLKLYSEDDIERFEAELARDGQVRIGNRWLAWDEMHGFHQQTKEPITVRYLGIYYGGAEGPNLDQGMETDTDSVREYVEGINEDRSERNATAKARELQVITATVPLNEVVWVSDRAGQSEFIVCNRPGGVFISPDGKLSGELAKSQVRGYTRADGTYVPPHQDKRTKKPKKAVQVDLFASGGDPRRDAMESLKARVTKYASGLSRTKDFATAAWAGHGVGVEIGEMSEDAMRELARVIVDYGTPAFVDSGAFGVFMRGLKHMDVEGGQVSGLDFDAVLAKYDRLLEMISEANAAEESVPSPLLVMPDVVGDQLASLELIHRHRGYVRATAQFSGVARPIIPIQRGPLPMAEAYRRLVDMLGTDDFIVGVPSNAAAVTPAEFTEFLRDARPRAVHILGAFADSRLMPRLSQILDSGVADQLEVTADANPLRSIIIEKGQTGDERRAALADKLGARARAGELEQVIRKFGGVEAMRRQYQAADGDRQRRLVGLISDLSGDDQADVLKQYGLSPPKGE